MSRKNSQTGNFSRVVGDWTGRSKSSNSKYYEDSSSSYKGDGQNRVHKRLNSGYHESYSTTGYPASSNNYASQHSGDTYYEHNSYSSTLKNNPVPNFSYNGQNYTNDNYVTKMGPPVPATVTVATTSYPYDNSVQYNTSACPDSSALFIGLNHSFGTITSGGGSSSYLSDFVPNKVVSNDLIRSDTNYNYYGQSAIIDTSADSSSTSRAPSADDIFKELGKSLFRSFANGNSTEENPLMKSIISISQKQHHTNRRPYDNTNEPFERNTYGRNDGYGQRKAPYYYSKNREDSNRVYGFKKYNENYRRHNNFPNNGYSNENSTSNRNSGGKFIMMKKTNRNFPYNKMNQTNGNFNTKRAKNYGSNENFGGKIKNSNFPLKINENNGKFVGKITNKNVSSKINPSSKIKERDSHSNANAGGKITNKNVSSKIDQSSKIKRDSHSNAGPSSINQTKEKFVEKSIGNSSKTNEPIEKTTDTVQPKRKRRIARLQRGFKLLKDRYKFFIHNVHIDQNQIMLVTYLRMLFSDLNADTEEHYLLLSRFLGRHPNVIKLFVYECKLGLDKKFGETNTQSVVKQKMDYLYDEKSKFEADVKQLNKYKDDKSVDENIKLIKDYFDVLVGTKFSSENIPRPEDYVLRKDKTEKDFINDFKYCFIKSCYDKFQFRIYDKIVRKCNENRVDFHLNNSFIPLIIVEKVKNNKKDDSSIELPLILHQYTRQMKRDTSEKIEKATQITFDTMVKKNEHLQTNINDFIDKDEQLQILRDFADCILMFDAIGTGIKYKLVYYTHYINLSIEMKKKLFDDLVKRIYSECLYILKNDIKLNEKTFVEMEPDKEDENKKIEAIDETIVNEGGEDIDITEGGTDDDKNASMDVI